MARGTALSELRQMLKAEIGAEMDETISAADNTRLNKLLANQQKWLAGDFHWPFLDTTVLVTITAGTRYYSIPTTYLNIDRLRDYDQRALWNTFYYELRYGIGEHEYNIYDPIQDQRSDPIDRWQITDQAGTAKLEVWPVPASDQVLRLRGQRPLVALSAETDVCDLDDLLIVLFTAAEILARDKKDDAQAKLAKAQRHLARLKMNYAGDGDMFVLGGGPQNSWRKRDRRPTVATMRNDEQQYSNSVDITPGAYTVTVVFPTQLPRAARAPGLDVSGPQGGDNIFARLIEGTLNSTGFSVELSATPTTTGYKLYYSCAY